MKNSSSLCNPPSRTAWSDPKRSGIALPLTLGAPLGDSPFGALGLSFFGNLVALLLASQGGDQRDARGVRSALLWQL